MRSDQPGVQDDVADVDPFFCLQYHPSLTPMCHHVRAFTSIPPLPAFLGRTSFSLSLGSDFWLSAWPSARISSMSVLVGTLPHRQLIAYHLGYSRGLLLSKAGWRMLKVERSMGIKFLVSNKQILSPLGRQRPAPTALDHLCLGLISHSLFCWYHSFFSGP